MEKMMQDKVWVDNLGWVEWPFFEALAAIICPIPTEDSPLAKLSSAEFGEIDVNAHTWSWKVPEGVNFPVIVEVIDESSKGIQDNKQG